MTQCKPENEAKNGEVCGAFGTGHAEEHDAGDFPVEKKEGAEELPRACIVKLHGEVSA